MIPSYDHLPAYRPPRGVGKMEGFALLPAALLWIGTEVETHDGRRGVVVHYEFFWDKQTDFPVRFGNQTLMLTKRHLRSHQAPAPTPQPQPADEQPQPRVLALRRVV